MKINKYPKHILYSRSLITAGLSVLMIMTGSNIKNNVEGYVENKNIECTPLEKLTGTNGLYSTGFRHGTVYSIDGKAISYDTGDSEDIHHYAVNGFSSVIGSDTTHGIIYENRSTLYSSAHSANVSLKKGNNIVTTLSYNGQTTAFRLLNENLSFETCDSACVAVLLADGTILVDAGLNEYDFESDFTEKKDACLDYGTINERIGSIAKPITSRTLLQFEDEVSGEYSLYNPEFYDFPSFSANGVTIHNHDYSYLQNYPLMTDEKLPYRLCSYSESLVYSSNTYYWRHALNFGLEKLFKAEKTIFGITTPITTDSNIVIPGVEAPGGPNNVRLDYYHWGQDFYVSPIRTLQIYTHCLSGKSVTPHFITAVDLPDGTQIYRSKPKTNKSMEIDIPNDDTIKAGMADCFRKYCEHIDPSVYAPYQNMIENNQLLSKSGTADCSDDGTLTNHTRVLAVLDEKGSLIAISCIFVKHATADTNISDTKLYSILLQTLAAANVL